MLVLEAAIPKALKVAHPGTPEFRAALRTAIENIKGLRGAAAVHTFFATDHAGADRLGVCVVRVDNGGWKLVDYTKSK